ncbi:cyclic peptide export ABC transporter [Acanthopleuribacter pedis]|uniref:Cyclic peptide export ABC transporter n=1 Tax=Acanthopleuribacter pedis TaxID=442870 RepID=A0A8J7QEQ0_9BACT|nr:cyclic peptide export ABC transporter [Acanthopleuribacter pedis]MBO1319421.1 cyclic peptide export ABC transporter [Acanthopleuribacter pedis]
MPLIVALFRKSRVLLLSALAANVFSAALGVLLVALINNAVASPDLQFQGGVPLFVGLVLVLFASGVWSQNLLNRLGAHIVRELRCMMVRRVLATPLATVEALGSHRIYTLLTSDIGNLSWAFGMVPVIAMNAMIAVLGFAYLGWLSPLFLVATLALLVFGIGGTQLLLQRMRGLFEENRRRYDRLFRHFGSVVYGGKELRLNRGRAQYFYNQQFQGTVDRLFETGMKADLFGIVSNNWNNLILFAVLATVLFAAPLVEGAGREVVIGYILTLIYLRGPLNSLVGALPAFSRGRIALRQFEDLDLPPLREAADASPPVAAGNWQQLRLEGLRFSYPDQGDDYTFAVGPIDMTFKRGEIVFIIGGNGSGKSTFAKLVTGLYPAAAGSIHLDDVPIDADNLDWYRNHFSAVFSDYHLFDQLLDAEGEPPEDARVKRYLEHLCLDHKVHSEAGVLSRTDLSAGQRKRLAYIHTLLEDRSLILFDEWAADQDPVFRELFYRELLPKLRDAGKTLLVISHDDRYFGLADRLFKFENGVPRQLPIESITSAPLARM